MYIVEDASNHDITAFCKKLGTTARISIELGNVTIAVEIAKCSPPQINGMLCHRMVSILHSNYSNALPMHIMTISEHMVSRPVTIFSFPRNFLIR